MNKARIKLLIADLKAAEQEILLCDASKIDCETLLQLKTAIDDFRLTVWSSMVHSKPGADRQEYVQAVRMSRVVDMLRDLRRHKAPRSNQQDKSFSFTELVRVAEEAIVHANGSSN